MHLKCALDFDSDDVSDTKREISHVVEEALSIQLPFIYVQSKVK